MKRSAGFFFRRVGLVLVPLAMLLFWDAGCAQVPSEPAAPAPVGEKKQAIINGTGDLSQPAIGALTYRNSPFCTGTLITSQLVVTAAHCVDAIVRYGTSSVQFRVDFPPAAGSTQKFRSENHAILRHSKHPKYPQGWDAQRGISPYDIAIVILKNKVTNVTPIPINRTGMEQAWIGTNVHVVGYGQIQTNPQPVSADQKYAADIPLYQIDPGSFVHYDQKTQKSACHGDSGGPALYKVNGKDRVLGVTSIAYKATSAGGGQTLCDGGAVSTRTDSNLEFLRPFLLQYNDGPEPCTEDKECAPCGSCNATKKVCEPIPVTKETSTCQPCKSDADCGTDGKCEKFEDGYRCLQPCNSNGCCPEGTVCLTGSDASAKKYCHPLKGSCDDVTCQKDEDCGLGGACTNSVCKPNLPKPIPNLCLRCHTSEQCGAGNFCYNGSSPNGYCIQQCGEGGFCPDGFTCQQIAPGISQCAPIDNCVIACDDKTPCPSGYKCDSNKCALSNAGKEGDPCDKDRPCEDGMACFSGQCVRPCGAPVGAAGSPCDKDQKCGPGLTCANLGWARYCIESCTSGSICGFGGACTRLSRRSNIYGCACATDKDCGAGRYCNYSGSGYRGACADKPPQPECRAGLSCRPIPGTGSFCLPLVGEQNAGGICSYHTRCRQGTVCQQFATDSPPTCFEDCSSSGICFWGGQCTTIYGNTRYCFCFSDKDCGEGATCAPAFESQGRTYGTCRQNETAKCTRDRDCPQEFSCKEGKCVFDAAKKREPFPEFVPPEKPVAPEPAPEPVQDAATQPEPKPEPAPDAAAQPEPKPEPAVQPEPKPEPAPTENTEVTKSGCGCSSTGSNPTEQLPFFALTLLGLCFLKPRRS